jgi:outer membrane protein TolC
MWLPNTGANRVTVRRLSVKGIISKISGIRAGRVLGIGGCLLLHACTYYEPQPIATKPERVSDVSHLSVDASRLRPQNLTRHSFDPGDGLDMTEVAMLAVANNPDLKAARLTRKLTDAQLFKVGLLPDPVLSQSLDRPTHGGAQNPNTLDLDLGYALREVVTRPSALASAEATRRQVDLELLWKEWQVAQQARLLFLRRTALEARRKPLQQCAKRFADRYALVMNAISRGEMTGQQGSVLFTELFKAREQLNDIEQQDLKVMQQLNALLGLTPEVELKLVGNAESLAISDQEAQQRLAGLNEYRPDLLALQASYQSRKQQYREAILEQFPELTVGITRARDSDGLDTSGMGISLSLPFLNRNHYPVTVEQARREQLHAQYQARLDRAYAGVGELSAQRRLLKRQYKALLATLARLQQTVDNARKAYDNGDLDVMTYTKLETDRLDRDLQRLKLEQSLAELDLGLQTLLFCGC